MMSIRRALIHCDEHARLNPHDGVVMAELHAATERALLSRERRYAGIAGRVDVAFYWMMGALCGAPVALEFQHEQIGQVARASARVRSQYHRRRPTRRSKT